jgi:hypothetical protein
VSGTIIRRKFTVLRPDLEPPAAVEGAAGDLEAPAHQVRRVRDLPPEPTAAELVANFAGATARWVGAGFPVVSEAVYAARTAACEACELWVAEARLGLGKCLAPGCGCTKLKRWWASEKCLHPDGPRWPE